MRHRFKANIQITNTLVCGGGATVKYITLTDLVCINLVNNLTSH